PPQYPPVDFSHCPHGLARTQAKEPSVRPIQLLGVAGVLVLGGCRDDGASGGGTETDTVGTSDDTSGDADETGELGEPIDFDAVGRAGLRRLTRHEHDNTLRDLLGDATRPGSHALPQDAPTPFGTEDAAQAAPAP